MPAKLNIIGEKYNLLTVIEEVDPIVNKKGHTLRRYKCQCDCGNKTIAQQNLIRSGNTKSCGCLQIDHVTKLGRSNKKHGHASKIKSETHGNNKHGHTSKSKFSKEYRCWSGMKSRCLYPSQPGYKNYGGRGIKVCDQWINSFKQFLSDVGPAPSPKATIDRLDSNKNYEPSNVRWVENPSIQLINRRINKNNTSGVKGVSLHKPTNKWTAYIYINYKHIYLGSFSNKEDAMKARLEAEEKYHKPLLKSV